MFGILVGLLASGFANISAGIINLENKKEAAKRKIKGENPFNTYIDYRGKVCDLDTGATVSFYTKDGHFYKKIGNKIIDLTKGKNETAAKKIMENPNGATVVFYDSGENGEDGVSFIHRYHDNIVGERYQDIENGEIYIKRRLLYKVYLFEKGKIKLSSPRYATFYMNIKTGLLVRVVDEERDKTISEEEEKKFIDLFNKLQKEEGYLYNISPILGTEDCNYGNRIFCNELTLGRENHVYDALCNQYEKNYGKGFEGRVLVSYDWEKRNG